MRGWLYLFQVLTALSNAWLAGQEAGRRIRAADEKTRLAAQHERLNEAKIAHEHNRANVLDEIAIELRLIELEERKLKLEQLRREAAMREDFKPSDYDDV